VKRSFGRRVEPEESRLKGLDVTRGDARLESGGDRLVLLCPIDARGLKRRLFGFERVVPSLEAVTACLDGLSGTSVRHLYLGLPMGRVDLQRALGVLPNLVSVDLLLRGDDAVEALSLTPQLETIRIRRTHDTPLRRRYTWAGGSPRLTAIANALRASHVLNGRPFTR